MALSLEDFAKPVRKGPPCSVPGALAALTDEVRALAEQALAGDPEVFPSTVIAQRMTEQGAPIKGHTIQRHRRGECSCGA